MDIYDRGMRLKELREARGLSQQEVADRLGVSRTTVSGYERNIKAPRIDGLEQLAIMYRTSVDYILGLDNRTSIFIDDLDRSQQRIVLRVVETLRDELKQTKSDGH